MSISNTNKLLTFENFIKFGIFLYFSVFFILSSGYSWGIVLVFLTAFVFIVRNFRSTEFKPLWLAVLLFGYFLINVYFVILKSDISFQIDLASRMLFAAVALAVLWRFKLSPKIIIIGLVLGAFLGFLLGFYQYYFLDAPRAYGRGSSSIWFGNFSTLFALLILIGLIYKPIFKNAFLSRLFILAGFFFASYSSLMSNTKASWVVLILGILLILIFTFKLLNFKLKILVLVGFLVAFVAIFNEPRFKGFINGMDFKNFTFDSSTQARVDMYEAGIQIFLKNPLTGVGRVGIKQAVNDLPISESKKFMPRAHPHLHNDFVDMSARYGILALLAVLLLYVLPLIYFIKHFFKTSIEQKFYALSGLIVVISYIGFSMFETPLYHNIGVMNYGFLTAIFASSIEYLRINKT